MGYPFATAALGPLLFLQGRHVRRVTPRLPEAA
ncbi:SGNH/GDSL hydrolase family protein, partial [Burkholderia ambifaria]|nr:SGNH/GDSL hydrolase family protein [Burkholderia ambifaria]